MELAWSYFAKVIYFKLEQIFTHYDFIPIKKKMNAIFIKTKKNFEVAAC